MRVPPVKIYLVCIIPVRNIFSDEDAFFLLSLSWKLECIELKQYHCSCQLKLCMFKQNHFLICYFIYFA